MRGRAAAGLVAVFVAGAVAAQSVSTPFAHTLKPRGFAEECFKLAGGETIDYAFESSAAMEFNIHFHRGKDVVYPVKADAVSRAAERFTAPSAEEFCLMWTNGTAAMVTVKGTLSR